jgi:DNA repair exonuclease SbcCD ATPase subunit
LVAAIRKDKEEVERLDKVIKDLKIFTKALKQTQAELRKEFVEAVNYTMNKLWQTLYPYQDFISVRLAVEEGDYVLQLQERTTNWVNVEGAASGGERSIACLALRIAFALVLAPHLRLLVLDEPTANLDANSVKVLANTLREGISEFIDQCFIITHDDAFEEAVTGYAYRLERDKGKDEATKVIQIN